MSNGPRSHAALMEMVTMAARDSTTLEKGWEQQAEVRK